MINTSISLRNGIKLDSYKALERARAIALFEYSSVWPYVLFKYTRLIDINSAPAGQILALRDICGSYSYAILADGKWVNNRANLSSGRVRIVSHKTFRKFIDRSSPTQELMALTIKHSVNSSGAYILGGELLKKYTIKSLIELQSSSNPITEYLLGRIAEIKRSADVQSK